MINDLFDALRQDRWRSEHAFSEDIRQAHDVMHHPFVAQDDIAETLRLWFERRQPCLFGRYAAKRGGIHICVVTERDLNKGDAHVRATIAEEIRLWKQRALNREHPEHSFVLAVNSARLALAAPDDNLARFGTHIRGLTGWEPSTETHAPVASDFLYLKSPLDSFYYGFQFNLDFFAAAGDGRWWHDHRVPGGIAFTANATGHMKQFQEWYAYKDEPDRGGWFLRLAMQTISMAEPMAGRTESAGAAGKRPVRQFANPNSEGKIAWLLDLEDGRPLKKGVECPFKDDKEIIKTIAGKDWTTYAGLTHTDHNVRKEFFDDRDQPSSSSRPYLNDFTYLYSRTESDFVKFTAGIRVAEKDVFAETGDPNTWTTRGAVGASDGATEVQRLLDTCKRWTEYPETR